MIMGVIEGRVEKMGDPSERLGSKGTGKARSHRPGGLDSTTVFESSEDVEVLTSFGDMNLREELLQGIFAYSKFCAFVHVGTQY